MSAQIPQIPGGYFLVARKIIESMLMDKPAHYLKLWIWMLGKAFWKDGDKLKRGQFFTTIEDMQNACSHRIGYRLYKPSVKEIRDAYESFTKDNMIGRMKGTRGMVITIINFDIYQNPLSYEGHDGGHDGGKTKGTGKMKKENKEKKLKEETLKPTCKQFDIFWKAYPKKVGKQDAEKAWMKLAPSEQLFTEILQALDWQCQQDDWLKNGGQFVKQPAAWLSGKRWEDEKPTTIQAAQKVIEIAPKQRAKGIIPPNPPETDWLGGSSFDYQE